MYEYTARCVYVVDGDTFDFDVDLGFRIAHRIRVRLVDVDTAELRSKNTAERVHAQQAKALCQEVLMGEKAPLVRLRTHKDKIGIYGRYAANVWLLTGAKDAEGIEYVGQSLGDILAGAGMLKKESYPDD